MTAEDIGSLYPTKIPAYTDNADIKAALRLYHYGSESYLSNNTDPSLIPADSIAGKLKAIEQDINAIELAGTGSEISDTQPSSPVNGYIWADRTTSATEKTAYIYNSSDSTWYKISGVVDVDEDYDWTGLNTFSQEVEFGSYIVAKGGINNFQNPSSRDSEITSPVNGLLCFIRQTNLGVDINDLQYYYNGTWFSASKVPTDPVISGIMSLSSVTKESVTISSTPFSGTYPFYLKDTNSIRYISAASVANGVIDFRGTSGGASVSSILAVGESATCVLMITNGTTPYYPTQITVDGTSNSVSVRWQDGITPLSGNASSIDVYTFTILRTGTSSEYLILASQAKFA
jgi:hypothetical protein